jgi:hypothetical protein
MDKGVKKSTVDIGHAARAAEGVAAWNKAWASAWARAGSAASDAESAGYGALRSSRKAWAEVLRAARDSRPPLPSDVAVSGQWIPAWDSAWVAAWSSALLAAKAKIADRPDDAKATPKKWDTAGRAERAALGSAAGSAAWDEIYRLEIQKVV